MIAPILTEYHLASRLERVDETRIIEELTDKETENEMDNMRDGGASYYSCATAHDDVTNITVSLFYEAYRDLSSCPLYRVPINCVSAAFDVPRR